MSITDRGLAASMREHLGDGLTLFTGSLEDAPLELMVVSPVGDTSDAVRGFGTFTRFTGELLRAQRTLM